MTGVRRQRLAGGLLTITFLTAMAPALWPEAPRWPGGAAAWFAALLMWRDIPARARRQSVVLVGVGGLAMAPFLVQGTPIPWRQALGANALLIGMLIAVSFLRLVSHAGTVDGEVPGGRRALWRTLLGLHLFSSVINITMLFIVGDRLARDGTLGRRRATVLARGFVLAAYWSPFFAAMATALTWAEGARLDLLMALGLPLAAVGLLLTVWERPAAADSDFHGYPMNFAGLWVPGLLAALVLTIHQLWPPIPVLAVIAISAPAISLLLLAIRAGPAAAPALRHHVESGLPRLLNELLLFIAAGVLAAGLGVLFANLGGWLPFTAFGPLEATVVLLVIVAAAVAGIHPVVTIATFGTLLAPLEPNPHLLAMSYLAGWAIGLPISPFSGVGLALQGRYHVRAGDIIRWNYPWGLAMMALTVGGFFIMERLSVGH
ncbi:MAG: hypothetical protein U5S82_17870 [Gammaproteobacteria bacterium]|nr:hypothetical protein [Gammaproteobacteria bacterium]